MKALCLTLVSQRYAVKHGHFKHLDCSLAQAYFETVLMKGLWENLWKRSTIFGPSLCL